VKVRFNPETKKFLTWPVPGGGTVRNMDIDKNGNLRLAESGAGKIPRHDQTNVRNSIVT
jgi:streptogramin lyase